MSSAPPNRAVPFLAAFNDIEAHLRDMLDAKRSDSFRWMVGQARRRGLINEAFADELQEFAQLRNAISHGPYRDYRPIAEPLPETVAAIEFIRDALHDPPTAMSVLGDQQVVTVSPGDDIRVALQILRTTTISQFPVYDTGRCVDLLTTNTIARWVAADLDDNDHLDGRTVRDVLDYAESSDYAVFLPRDVLAQEALEALTTPPKRRPLPRAAIITEVGRADHRPVRVIGGSDIAALVEAVSPLR